MIRVGILGDIGSGKSYVANTFGYPVFNADLEVAKLYNRNRKIYKKLKKTIPNNIFSFPINKSEVLNAILSKKSNLNKITKIVHPEVQKKMKIFLRKNKDKKIVVLDIPLLMENKINKKNDILIFVDANKIDILKRMKKRKNFNMKIYEKFRSIQLKLDYKKKKSKYVIKNNFSRLSVKKYVKDIISKILNERSSIRY
jgi:dephospho-CoA kinase